MQIQFLVEVQSAPAWYVVQMSAISSTAGVVSKKVTLSIESTPLHWMGVDNDHCFVEFEITGGEPDH